MDISNPSAEPSVVASTPVEETVKPPRKFPITLIIIPILLLLIMGTSIYYLYKKYQTSPISTTAVLNITPTKTPLLLVLQSPNDGDLAINEQLLVSGSTKPDATVVIYTDSDETTVVSDSSGHFESTITLSKGDTQITITSYTDEGEEQSITKTIAQEGSNEEKI